MKLEYIYSLWNGIKTDRPYHNPISDNDLIAIYKNKTGKIQRENDNIFFRNLGDRIIIEIKAKMGDLSINCYRDLYRWSSYPITIK
jgi:hypothetical protein